MAYMKSYHKCVVGSCTPNEDVPVHSFPRNEEMKKKWLHSIGVSETFRISKRSGICGRHFLQSCYYGVDNVVCLQEAGYADVRCKPRLLPGSIPTEYLDEVSIYTYIYIVYK